MTSKAFGACGFQPRGLSTNCGIGLFCLLLMLCSNVQAQPTGSTPRNVQFSNFSTEVGFSSEFVHDVVQDGHGFMWAATQSGLNRYDGHDVVVYENAANDPTSIGHNFVWTLHVDPEGTLWVGTERGINRYDPVNDNFIREPWPGLSLANFRVRKIIQDDRGFFWIGTLGSGLIRLDPFRAEMTRFVHDPSDSSSLPNNHVMGLVLDRRGELWVGTDGGGMARFDPASNNFVAYRSQTDNPLTLSDDRIRSIYEDASGNLWIGTNSAGLNLFDPATGRFTRLASDPNRSGSLPGGQVLAVFEDSYGTLWVGTEEGLAEWRPKEAVFAKYQSDAANLSSLINNRVNAITQDTSGVLWIATHGGLSTWNYFSDSFTYHSTRNGELLEDIVTSVGESSNGTLWVGTYGGGLSSINPLTGEVLHYRYDKNQPDSLPDDQVMSLLVDRQDRVWVGMRTGGLALKLPSKDGFERFVHEPQRGDSLGGNAVSSIMQDADGGLWVGNYGAGLNYAQNGDPSSFKRFLHNPELATSISGDRVLRVYQEQSGIIWVGTEGDGLNKFDFDLQQFSRIDLETTTNDSGRPRGTPWEIFETPDQSLWLGTLGQGLFRWSVENRQAGVQQFEQYTSAQGLSSEIYSITGGSAGELWLSSNRGLFEFFPDSLEVRKFDRNNGLRTNEFIQGARLRSRSGRLLFGSNSGLVGFFPGDLPKNSHPPRISLEANSRTVTLARTWVGDEPPLVQLDYFDAFIAFDFVALDYVSPDKNEYRYRLTGLDNEWTNVSNFRRAIYSSLSPGHYNFEVQASNNDGVWNRIGVSADVYVVPPPWSTWWAYIVYSGLLALLIGLYFRSQRAKQQAEAETRVRLKKLVNERTAELAERNTDLMSLNNQLEHASVTDALTGLRNRRFVDQHIAAEVSMLQRTQFEESVDGKEPNPESPRLLFLMMIDLDGFKSINDNFGHQAGDRALLEVKDRLLTACRKSDVVVRWGGDEFLIIGHARTMEGAEQFTEKIRQSIGGASYDLGHGDIGKLSGSIGIAAIPFVPGKIEFATWEQVCSIADMAAYVAKDSGRDGWVSVSGTRLLAKAELAELKYNLTERINEGKLRVNSSDVLPDTTFHQG
ncbi:MAG: diguanylate cyclase (GGDEF)-like protein [Candidatus Azotimanducaceae bacterium]|jgi:diguanylate cyclase (GGDEF)-like protein